MGAPTERLIETRDGAVRTRVLVGGGGPPLVYLHGVEGLQWDEFLDGLASSHTVHAVEHVGSGESAGLEHLWDFWDLVVHYEEAFDALGLGPAALVGHSFGGMVAAEVGAHLRQRVTRLVLLAPLGLWDDDHPVVEIDAVDRARRAEVLLADPTRPLPRLLAPAFDDHEALFHADLNSASINQFTWPIPDKGLRRRLYRITAPTLLVWGAEDRVVNPAYAGQFAAGIPDTTAAVVPDLGHLLQLEDPKAVLAHVAPFLGG